MPNSLFSLIGTFIVTSEVYQHAWDQSPLTLTFVNTTTSKTQVLTTQTMSDNFVKLEFEDPEAINTQLNPCFANPEIVSFIFRFLDAPILAVLARTVRAFTGQHDQAFPCATGLVF
jgi:hypothetical protein